MLYSAFPSRCYAAAVYGVTFAKIMAVVHVCILASIVILSARKVLVVNVNTIVCSCYLSATPGPPGRYIMNYENKVLSL